MREVLVNVGIGIACIGVLIEFVAVAQRVFIRRQLRPTFQLYALGGYVFYAGVAIIIGAKIIL